MLKKILLAAAVSGIFLGGADKARAQFLDMSSMVANELAFQNQFYKAAWKGSQYIASLPSDGTPLPFNAMTLSQANQQAAQAWNGYIQQSQYSSKVTSNAIANWTNGAVNGVGPYYNPHTGQAHQLPWTHNHYNINHQGYVTPGYNHHAPVNLYPYYGR